MAADALKNGQVDLGALRELYSVDPTAKRIFRDLAGRQRNYGEIKVNRTAQRVGASRREVIRIFRRLHDAGCGQFIVGRGGWPSRFVWDVEMIEVGKAAAGQAEQINPVDPGAPTEPEEERLEASGDGPFDHFVHSFQLRPDLSVSLELPADLTASEAARLAEFVKTLPFDTQ
jgi:hypothetical protein